MRLGRFLPLACASLFGSIVEGKGLNDMTREEKVGQLFMPFVVPEMGGDHLDDARRLVKEHRVGGFLVKWGTPAQKRKVVKDLRAQSATPLLFAVDAEWGVAMNARGVPKLPRAMTVAATGNMAHLMTLGYLTGLQCRAVGAHIAFGPVVDVNTNPLNPIIGTRAFGEEPQYVARCAQRVIHGMQFAGVASCIKHWPGHGDTSTDSHTGLPRVDKTYGQLKHVEMVPYKQLIEKTDAVMTAHIQFPGISQRPATMVGTIVNGMLRRDLGFDGVVFTDAMNMQAVADHYAPEQAAVLALKAGCDVILYGEHQEEKIQQLMQETIPQAIAGVVASDITDAELDTHVRRVLKLKGRVSHEQGRLDVFNNDHVKLFNKTVFEEAITLVRDPQQLLPLKKGTQVFCLTYGDGPSPKLNQVGLEGAECVIATFYRKPTEDEVNTVAFYADQLPTIVVLHTSPYEASRFGDQIAVVTTYEDHPQARQAAQRALVGVIPFKGKLR